MNREWLSRLLQVAAVSLTIVAILQELEKPPEERKWHGKVSFVPYDFRLPTCSRLKETFWNPYDSSIFTPTVFGVGWAVNFYPLFERCGCQRQCAASEEDFLMPTRTIKNVLTHH